MSLTFFSRTAILALVGAELLAAAPVIAQPSPPAAVATAAVATAAGLITNAIGRPGEDLDGDWQVIVDPMSVGDTSAVSAALPGQQIFEDRRDPPPLALVEYAFSPKDTLRVPGDWNAQRDRLFFYEGPVWYRRLFSRPSATGRSFLHFGAANYAADVYLNGRLLAKHRGGFTPFDVEVTSALRAGENSLVVKVDNTLTGSTVPARKTDWLNRGGLTRSVRLLSTPSAFIRQYDLALVDRERRRIRVRVRADGTGAGQSVRVSVGALAQADIRLDGAGVGETTIAAPVELWAPSHPRLYDVRLSLGADIVNDRIGFRTIERQGARILLNGKPIFLRGIASQEESPLHLGRAHGRADALAIAALVKRLHADYLRLGQYLNDETMARVADEQGLLLWEEVPVFWTMDWTNPATAAAARSQLEELVTRDRNRASVIFWSVGNETPMSAPRLAFMRDLVHAARGLDGTRLITSALLGDPRKTLGGYVQLLAARLMLDPATAPDRKDALTHWLAGSLGHPPTRAELERLAYATTITVEDPIGEDLDVVSFNEYFGWYYPPALSKILPVDEPTLRRLELQVMPELSIGAAFDKPLLISEFGADAVPGRVGDEQTLFTEAYQARLFRAQLAMLRNSPRLAGISPWVLRDFQTPLRLHPYLQNYWNHKGLVGPDGTPKLAFRVLQEAYRQGWPVPPPAVR